VLLVLMAGVSCSDDNGSRSSETDLADTGDAAVDAAFRDTVAGDTASGNDGGGADTATDDSGGADASDTGPTPVAPEVDPTCIDGQYTEALPDPSVDISAEMHAYQPSNLHGFIDAILTKRWPVGAWVVQQALTNPALDCVEVFTGDTSTPGPVLGRLSVVVHECGHLQNFTSRGSNVTPSLTFSCGGGAGRTFDRSNLIDDQYQQQRPRCPGGFPNGNCDQYADTYLEGDSGAQGFDMLFEEMHQYVNSLATGYAFHDYMSSSRSEMDGILTFMWYLERYLRMARLEYPQDYSTLVDDACWREAILTMWGRAWLMLSAAEGHDTLGISEEALFELVRTPELLEEIQRVRDAEGCN
jgi:hypothetical protein